MFSNRAFSTMKTGMTVMLVAIGILVVCGLICAVTGTGAFLVPLVVGTFVWAGLDSARIQLRKFESGISYGPVVLGVLCSFLWILVFPWYLVMRSKIRQGTARLRPEFEPWNMDSGEISPRGLVQPWHGRKL